MPEIKQDIRGATFVVAADDSVHKNMADYVCDGTADDVEIQSAIDALPASGGKVLLLDGTYTLAASVNLDSYQTLRGCGRNTILTTTAVVAVLSAVGTDGFEKVGIVISDLSVDGTLGGSTASAFYWEFVDYSTIENTYLSSCVNPIEMGDCDHNWIIENTILDDTGTYSSIYLWRFGGTSDDNIIAGNLIYNSSRSAIKIDDGERCIISNNITEGNANWGIYVIYAPNTVIKGNICLTEGAGGIWIDADSDNSVVTGNTVKDSVGDGILLDADFNCSVTGNTVESAGNFGINILASFYINVVGNNIIGCAEGIELNNTSESGYHLVSSNTIRNTTTHGILVTHSYDNKIIGNLIEASSTLTNITYDGIFITYSDRIDIHANTIRRGAGANKARYGINIDADSNDNRVLGNDLYDSGSTGNFNDAGTLTIVQDDNKDITPVQVKHMVYAQNTSGGNLLTGNVVAFEVTATAAGFHSPTAIGDPMVWGMLAEDIDNNAFGYIQVLGGTTVLDATNVGGGAIVIGDLLCTEVGSRARKVGAGHIVFAIAMEDCDVVDGVINALIISPRMI